MEWNYTEGVKIHQIESDQFLRSKIIFRFQKHYDEELATCWSITSECINVLFRTKEEITYRLWNTQINSSTSIHRDKLWLSVSIDTVNIEEVILETIKFVIDIIFESELLISKKIFGEGKKNSIFNICFFNESDELKAAKEIMTLHFGEQNRLNGFSIGNKDTSEKISYLDYLSVIDEIRKEVGVDILFIGGISQETLKTALAKIAPSSTRKENRILIEKNFEYPSTFVSKTESAKMCLSKLMITYNTGVYLGDDDYPSLLVYDGILGAFSFSLLGLRIRKEGIAYYATSTADPYRGYQIINTDINKNVKEKFVDILDNEVRRIKNGDFSLALLIRIKKAITNQLLLSMDNSSKLIEDHFIDNIYFNKFDGKKLIDAVNDVNKKEIMDVANKIKKKAEYFLRDE